ncbi:dihydromonapterin reductase [Thiomicrorhabdus xiamenensis]|uniref:Dihydromonapterin reductase n=1 Tax=Thiomicrorhabdus xiamenensis TaxID=2739063 RepID=A0A7D4NT49_9GAMM|nr:dihydromonapterin reductase [Thiomicrorhabdus xiamenensis]
MEQAVLITGAGQRVGFYLAEQFLTQGRYPVVITYRKPRPEIDRLVERGAIVYQVDFCDQEQFQSWLENLRDDIESLRAIIHNASIWVTDAQIAERPELYDQLFKVHVETPYRINMALSGLLKNTASGLKDIISLSDANCDLNRSDYIAYLSSKAALQNQMRVFASKFAPQIKVNDIAPGLLMFHADDSESYKQQRLQNQLLPIEPGPEVIWQSVQYLMNNPYITGASMPVDGGVRLIK